jgi:uncharacterized protein
VRVLVAAISTRALAESAARAGFAVTAIDAFADADQHPSVRAISLGERFSPDAAARTARTIASDALVYGSNFENDPDAIERLSQRRRLWGNSTAVIRRVRDPQTLSEALRDRGLAAPAIAPDQPSIPPSRSSRAREWLVKRRASGGGHGVRRWRAGMRVPRNGYLQELIDGMPASIVFAAAGGRTVPLGLCRQLIGDEAFGSSAFRYCGNILTAAGEDDELLEPASAVARVVSDEFRLVGVNGIDLVAAGRVPYAVEVNPRWCASMELVERAYGISVFGAHAEACRDGALPLFDVSLARRGARTVGKAIVFARWDVRVNETRKWLDAADVRDVPRAGASIRAGHPVCTVFAEGRDAADCYSALVERAGRVYAML